MDENLQRLARELRTERCPTRVLEKVEQQIRGRRPPVYRFRVSTVAVALCLAAVTTVAMLRFWPAGQRVLHSETSRSATADQVRVAREATLAISYIGTILLETKAHNESVLLKEAVPHLQSSFETVSKIIQTKL